MTPGSEGMTLPASTAALLWCTAVSLAFAFLRPAAREYA